MNSVGPQMHRDLADVWPVLGSDRVRAGRRGLRGGPSVLGRRELRLHPGDDRLVRDPRAGDARGPRPGAEPGRRSTSRWSPGSAARRSGPGWSSAMLADVSVAGRRAKIIDGHTRLGVAAGDHAAICWPLMAGMAKAKYYLLTCDPLTRRGSRTHRPGLQVRRGRRRDRRGHPDRRAAGRRRPDRHRVDEARPQPLVPSRHPRLRGLARRRVPRLRRPGGPRRPRLAPREAVPRLHAPPSRPGTPSTSSRTCSPLPATTRGSPMSEPATTSEDRIDSAVSIEPGVALVTGAGGGIGRAIVADLVRAGYTVAACDLDLDAATAADAVLPNGRAGRTPDGRPAAAYRMDVSDSEQVARRRRADQRRTRAGPRAGQQRRHRQDRAVRRVDRSRPGAASSTSTTSAPSSSPAPSWTA